MAISNVGKNYMLGQLATQIPYVALYSDNACTTEITGGSPAYARKMVTWGTASAGSMSITNQPVFDIPAGTTVRGVGFVSAVSGGTQLANYDVADEAFTNQGTYKILSASINLNK